MAKTLGRESWPSYSLPVLEFALVINLFCNGSEQARETLNWPSPLTPFNFFFKATLIKRTHTVHQGQDHTPNIQRPAPILCLCVLLSAFYV